MKIYPTQQNFNSIQLKVVKPSKKMVDRITIGTSAMLATIILGSGYMVRDKDYFESRYALTENKVFNMTPFELDAMVERFNIENLKIKPSGDNNFSYEAKNGHFKTISGSFNKSPSEGIIRGTYKEKGLLKENSYNFTLKQYPKEDIYQNVSFELKYASTDNPYMADRAIIYQNKDTKQVYLNGREMLTQEERDGKTFGLIFLAITLASLGYMAKEDKTEDQ